MAWQCPNAFWRNQGSPDTCLRTSVAVKSRISGQWEHRDLSQQALSSFYYGRRSKTAVVMPTYTRDILDSVTQLLLKEMSNISLNIS